MLSSEAVVSKGDLINSCSDFLHKRDANLIALDDCTGKTIEFLKHMFIAQHCHCHCHWHFHCFTLPLPLPLPLPRAFPIPPVLYSHIVSLRTNAWGQKTKICQMLLIIIININIILHSILSFVCFLKNIFCDLLSRVGA